MKTLPFVAVIAFAAMLLPSPVKAESPEEQVQAFLEQLMEGNVEDGFDALLEGSVIPENNPDALPTLVEQTKKGLKVYGKPLGSEEIGIQAFGESIKNIVYLVKCENLPLVWYFTYYNSGDEWKIVNVRFNDDADGIPGAFGKME